MNDLTNEELSKRCRDLGHALRNNRVESLLDAASICFAAALALDRAALVAGWDTGTDATEQP